MTFDKVSGAEVPPTPPGTQPRCAADCVDHCKLALNHADWELAIAKINLLVHVARSDAAIETIETTHRRILKTLNAPLSASEVET